MDCFAVHCALLGIYVSRFWWRKWGAENVVRMLKGIDLIY